MNGYDEMVDGRGSVRPHWRPVLGALAGLDPDVLADRTARVARAADEEGAAPAWRLDPVPLPLPSAEFALLEAGLAQRARLLDAILADLYGPQSALADGTLPSALVFGNPAFLRPCRGSPAPPGPRLQAYAADLARDHDGTWRVIADHTGALPGIGAAAEARRLLARVMPELFRPVQVRPLRPFFEAWGDALLRAAPAAEREGRAPLVALLTPGHRHASWPEHLMLSRELGCALVQADDLTARGGAVWLKTLGGLRPVDVLLRGVKGDALDPLELRAGGPGGSGVTGLLDAARHGAVRLLNDPGAALVEAPALAPFLPNLCRRLLGETLRLASRSALWLADPGAAGRVRADLGRWRLRAAFDPAGAATALHDLSCAARAAWDAKVSARPWDYVAVAQTAHSVAPSRAETGLAPVPVTLRLFLMHDGEAWRMMEGGLARVGESGAGAPEVVKDVWVLHEEVRDLRGPAPTGHPQLSIRRTGSDLPSRVADDFFWLGRYVERLEHQARLGRAALLRLQRGASSPHELAEEAVLARCLADAGLAGDDGLAVAESLRRAVATGGALALGLAQVLHLTDSLRDRLTGEMHGAMLHALRDAHAGRNDMERAGLDGVATALLGVQRVATTLAGLAAEGMVRGGGWRFLDLGRRLERAHGTALTLARVLDQPPARIDVALRLALELCDSLITYRGRYTAALHPAPALDLVLADPGNPRALGFQYAAAGRLLGEVDGSRASGLAGAAAGLLARTDALVACVAAATDPAGEAAGLPEGLRALAEATERLSDDVTRHYFALLPPLRTLGPEFA